MSFTVKQKTASDVPISNPLGGRQRPSKAGKKMGLLAFSHTVVEHRLYLAMLGEIEAVDEGVGAFSLRRLMKLTGLSSCSSIRRGCDGLVNKQSVEIINDGEAPGKSLYRIFAPDEIFERRLAAGIEPYPKEIQAYEVSGVFNLVIEQIVGRRDLSRRESLVALYCAEGLSNAEIGARLCISEKTVKYHLRHIFIKFGIKRRTELINRLLMDGDGTGRSDSVASIGNALSRRRARAHP